MNLISRRKDAAAKPVPDLAPLREQVAAMTGPVDRHDEAERAAQCLAQAQALRASVAGTVEAAQAALADVEAEAARMVSAARGTLRDAESVAQAAERGAAAVEDQGRAYRVAVGLAQQAREAFQGAQDLASERRERLADADALNARLSDLTGLQNVAQADLEAARAATDAEAAGEARTRLTGIQEVTPVLVAQRDAATARARAIGAEGAGGEYDAALARTAALVAERERALDTAEPERIEQRRAANPVGALLEDLAHLPAAHREQVLEAWGAGTQQPAGGNPIRRTPDGRIHGNVRSAH